MRGKLQYNLYHGRHKRITPADAGKTRESVARPDVVEDHPRGCGENRLRLGGLGCSAGITPADAGKTL